MRRPPCRLRSPHILTDEVKDFKQGCVLESAHRAEAHPHKQGHYAGFSQLLPPVDTP